MTASTEKNVGDAVSEFTLPEGCMLCGGAVSIRTTPGSGAHSYCAHCHWLSRTRLRMHKNGLEIAYATQALA
ncbi:hypothetical protein [Vitiosangium sp. GDMCC 1.1324]|uniref:hypothetical protein n=1 Tax=Vitiosangium sp. (strain GDMCC 1.1324) TaxID=2138576 RepID=UPI000D3B3E9A|nr:hypothetical protein [Vitiosangium sp. GDMCC 1.1324]PTL81869.1 hypothetical protein DAT35_21995 [Vitiosangium sp. GDMCC 1.1324]